MMETSQTRMRCELLSRILDRRRSPRVCRQLLKDFERVHWKTDPSGNMLKDIDKSDPARTHVSDALGYMIAKEFAMYPRVD